MTAEIHNINPKNVENKFLTLEDLSKMYGIGKATMYKYLKPLRVFMPKCKRKRYYAPLEVKFIIENLGRFNSKNN